MSCINYTDKKLKEIVNIYVENGVSKTAEILSIKPSTVERAVREAKRRDLFKDANNNKSKYVNQIIEQYTDSELKILASGKTRVLEQSKKLDINFNGNKVVIGAFSDTHIGHMKFYPERVYAAFEEFKKHKVDFICHSGDVTEGMSHRPGHIYELTHLGYDKQKQYTIDIFRQWTDTPIYAISGNHDRWYIKNNGANMVGDIASQLDNFEFIGHDEGDIVLAKNMVIRLWHGEDGNSYALSYRVQKILESLQGGDKPNVLFCGHTHKYVKLFERNVYAVSVGSIEDQTKWMRGKRIAANPCFFIFEITFNKDGVTKVVEHFYPFY